MYIFFNYSYYCIFLYVWFKKIYFNGTDRDGPSGS